MKIENAVPRSSRNGILPLLDSLLLVTLVVTMCSQVDLRTLGRDTLAAEHYNTKQLFIALSDVALVLGCAWFALSTTVQGAWKKLWWPPLPCWAFIFTMLISAVHSPQIIDSITPALQHKFSLGSLITKDSKEAIAEILQFAAYFIAAPLLFVNLIADRRGVVTIQRRRLVVTGFAAAVLVNLAVAIGQLMLGSASPRGLFGSAGIYCAFIAAALPLLLCYTLRLWRLKPALCAGAFAGCLAALGTMASPWAIVALIGGICFAGIFVGQSPRALMVATLSGLFVAGIWNMPVQLGQTRAESWHLRSETQPLKKQYIEWYAALGWSAPGRDLAATGVGPGNYQFNVGSYYSRLPNEEKMTPDSNNLYLVQTVSIGLLGISALFWLLSHFVATAWRCRQENRNNWLASGVLASLAALAVVNLFHATIVRGSGIVLAFVLSMAIVASQSNGVKKEKVHE